MTLQPAGSSPREPLAQALERWRLRVERELDAWLPPQRRCPARLHAAQRYSVLGPGKRIRPALVYATATTLGIPLEQVDAAACAVELIHCYSLVHDDLPAMDDDDLRRGRPDLSQAVRRSDSDPGRRLAAGAGVSSAGLASGPAGGCRGPRAHHRYARRRERHRRHGRWPGAGPRRRRRLAHLGRSRALARAQDRSAHPRERADGRTLPVGTRCRPALQALGIFGERVGLAFQVQDDILDVEGDVAGHRQTAGQRPGPRHAHLSGDCRAWTAARARVRQLHDEASRQLAAHGWQDSPLADLSHWLLTRNR